MSYADAGRGRERIAAIGLAGLVQTSIGVALLYGLAAHYAPRSPDTPLTAYPVDPPKPPPPVPIPEQTSERPATRAEPIATVTMVPIPLDPVVPTVPLPPMPLVPPNPQPRVAPTPTPSATAADLSRHAATRGAVSDWFPQSAYPAAALRAGATGRVGVTVTVAPDGRAASCDVTASSGNDALDTATCRLALRNGRFDPARDAAGAKATTRLTLPTVVWRLDN